MRVFGLDFTSSPSRHKPITLAEAELEGESLRLVSLSSINSFTDFEAFLSKPNIWCAGIDFPFGQPRKLVENLGWPSSWPEYVRAISEMKKAQFVDLLRQYQAGRSEGDKRHFRKVDKLAGACSPMQLDFVPVARMFFEGAPRLLLSSCSVCPVLKRHDGRIVVEAYPGLIARNAIGAASYKTDDKQKQNEERRRSRRKIVDELATPRMKSMYELTVDLDPQLAQMCIDDPTGDVLDAVLCTVQAAWAYNRKESDFGMPADCDPLEGWIPDPTLCFAQGVAG